MPFPVAAAIAAGATIAGQGIQMGATKQNNTKSYNRTRSLMDKQLEQNQQQALFNQKLQMEMWEKTGPMGQMEQLKKAGLNPGLIYGMGGAGGQTAQAAQAAPVSGGGFKGDNPGAGAGASGAILGEQLALMTAQRKNIEADTANKQAGAGKQTAETGAIPTQIEKAKAETANIQQGTIASKVATDINNLKLQKDTATFNDEIDIVMRERKVAEDMAKIKHNEKKISDATYRTMIDQIRADYAATLAINELTRQKTKESASNIQVNEAQIYKTFRDVAQGWNRLENEGKQTGINDRELSRKQVEDMAKQMNISISQLTSILGAAGIITRGPNTQTHYHETINYGE